MDLSVLGSFKKPLNNSRLSHILENNQYRPYVSSITEAQSVLAFAKSLVDLNVNDNNEIYLQMSLEFLLRYLSEEESTECPECFLPLIRFICEPSSAFF